MSAVRALAGCVLAACLHPAHAQQACPLAWTTGEPMPVYAGNLGCDPIGKYYAARRSAQPDWQGVHRCAVETNDDAVLMMMHANGYGVPRDLDRAIRHARCVATSPAELQGRHAHLLAIKAGTDGKPFDLCDDITSGGMKQFCAQIAETGAAPARAAAFAALEAKFTGTQRARFAALREAAGEYGRLAGETAWDDTGFDRPALLVSVPTAVLGELLADVHDAEQGKPPAPDDAAAADAALDAAWSRMLALETDADHGIQFSGVMPAAVEKTRRALAAYRDAWVAFARERYPAVPAAAWQARLARRHAARLQPWLR